MNGYISFIAIFAILVFALLIWWLIAKQIPKPNQDQQYKRKMHDQELLQLIYALPNPITLEKVKAASKLVKSEVRNRLRLLMMCGAIYPIQEKSGHIRSYSKKNPLPELDAPLNHQEYTLDQLKTLLEQHLNARDIHSGQIVALFGLRVVPAERLLNQWAKKGLVEIRYYKRFHKLYILKDSELPFNIPEKDLVDINKRRTVSKSRLIDLAAQNKGLVTPIMVVQDQKMSLAEAKIALDILVDQGVFSVDTDYYTGTVEYWLTDKSLIA